MIALFLLAAAQVQAVRLPPVVAPRPAPQTVPVDTQALPRSVPRADSQTAPRVDLSATVLPDLVVKAISVDDSGMYVQVANEGNADAKAFTIDAYATVGSRHGSTMIGGVSPGLAAGATQWVKVAGFFVAGEPAYPPPPPFELSKATAVRAELDPGPSGLGAFSSPPLPGEKPASTCTAEYGCVKEANEGNNELRLTGDAIGRGKPE